VLAKTTAKYSLLGLGDSSLAKVELS
jgi:hypothetical protein